MRLNIIIQNEAIQKYDNVLALFNSFYNQPFFSPELQEKFREKLIGSSRPMDPELRDVATPMPLIIVVEAIMWHLGFYKTSDLAVREYI